MQKTDQSRRIIRFLRSPFVVGLVITSLFVYFAHVFYQTREKNDHEKRQDSNRLYDIFEILDLKSSDLKFRWRGEKISEAPVVVLTIDDRSLNEIGRWPWSREKVAHVIDQVFHYGAKSVAMDIIFAEPQLSESHEALHRIEQSLVQKNILTSPVKNLIEQEESKLQPDQSLAKTIAQHHDHIILGAFSTSNSAANSLPFQDYCRNVSFRRINADKFINSQNSTFIPDDEADDFVDIEFEKPLKSQFDAIEEEVTDVYLKKQFQKKSVAELSSQEKSQLRFAIDQEFTDYCDTWLTPKDRFLSNVDLQNIYLEIFKKSKILQGLPFEQAIQTFKNRVYSHPIPQEAGWTINTDVLQKPADYTASFSAEQDEDGSIRKAALFSRTGNRIGTSFVPSLALQTYLVATGYQARIELNRDPKNPDQKILIKFQIYDISKDPEVFIGDVPVDKQGRLRINYAGDRNSFPYVSAKEFFNEKPSMLISQKKWIPQENRWALEEVTVDKASFIKDKSFIFGATAVGIYDLRVTPFDKNFPGTETHANILANLMDRNFLKVSTSESQWMIWLLALLGLFLTYVIAKSGAIQGFLLTSASVAILLSVDRWLFLHGQVMTVILPLFMTINLFVILTVYKYFTEERKKRHLRQTFSKYVSPAIVDEILKDPKNIELGGKKLRMSVFFSDIRGFTSISEKLDPQVLSDVLNQYLTPMTQIVFANKGTLDKYMGDAVMAFFGAPVSFEDHAVHACRCALESLKKVDELKLDFVRKGFPPIDIGIGVNTAEMSVGNMGSDIVRSYTVMGDAVNLGSRLESANKEYGTRAIISEYTYADIGTLFTCRELDWVRVKGKQQPIRIFELICEGEPPTQWVQLLSYFKEGFAFYHERKFNAALSCFEKALEIKPDDVASQLYIERCRIYHENLPPSDWDGVYEMKTK